MKIIDIDVKIFFYLSCVKYSIVFLSDLVIAISSLFIFNIKTNTRNLCDNKH